MSEDDPRDGDERSTRDEGLPGLARLSALVLAACVAVPLDPDSDDTVLRIILRAWHEDWLSGFFMLLMIGAPYLLGAFVVVAGVVRSGWATTLVKLPVFVLQTEALLLGLFALHDPNGIAPHALGGFGIVTFLYLVYTMARSRAHGDRLPLAFFARWGGLLIAGVFGWLVLQTRGGAHLGPAIWGTWASAALLAATARRPR